ncbi:hypothetical protein [Mycolicibacterium helvum]|uniref:Uncharacterized protein n=1 Tax=Mycolicibacterium helvum TaxID=1534349 RepID=A0A7I7T7W7_9MYCO|nr:hypothetical protein [Mycolicibacterium helvum]BBY65364.1 hypothetical protein MHEL_36070 [Mycolicibacterium helvum]
MIAIALFVTSGVLFLLAAYRREQGIPEAGARRPDHTTAFLRLQALCAAVGAIAVSVVHMITVVS